jgi:pimeloyl-ACP methyl ester carboxylesterase
MLHGYTGDRNEMPVGRTGERMFQRTARLFAAAGLATLRFDFVNSGQSDGRWEETTFSGQASDVRAVLDHLARLPDVDHRRVALLGFSQGGLVALRTGVQDQRVGTLVLWNPVLDPDRTYSRILGAGTLQDGYDRFRTNRRDSLVGASRLKPAFMYEVKTTHPIADGASFRGPILVVGARGDEIAGPVDLLAGLLAQERTPRPTQIAIVGGGHRFGTGSGPAVLDQVIDCSARFLAATLAGSGAPGE